MQGKKIECPKCKSTHIQKHMSAVGGWWWCDDCGFKSYNDKDNAFLKPCKERKDG
jgi:transposase-like protein